MEKRPYFIEFLDVIPFEFMRVVNLKLLHSTEMIQFVIGDGFFFEWSSLECGPKILQSWRW